MWRRHLAVAISANLASAGFLLLAEHFGGWHRVLAWAAATGTWVLLWFGMRFVVRPRWQGARSIWHYFPLTAWFCWFLDERRRRIKLEELVKAQGEQLRHIELMGRIADPTRRVDALRDLLTEMRTLSDQMLAPVIDEVRRWGYRRVQTAAISTDMGRLSSLTGGYLLRAVANTLSSRSTQRHADAR